MAFLVPHHLIRPALAAPRQLVAAPSRYCKLQHALAELDPVVPGGTSACSLPTAQCECGSCRVPESMPGEGREASLCNVSIVADFNNLPPFASIL